MTKTTFGVLFIVAGASYGSMAIDKVNELTLGSLLKYNFIKPPSQKAVKEITKSKLGRKGTILAYAAGLIAIGIYLIISPET